MANDLTHLIAYFCHLLTILLTFLATMLHTTVASFASFS